MHLDNNRSFVGNVPTARFYSVRLSHSTSTVGCLCGGRRSTSSKELFVVAPKGHAVFWIGLLHVHVRSSVII